MKKDKRGRKAIKSFKIDVGQLKEVAPEDIWNFRYRARVNGWKIETRKINGKFIVFRNE